MILACEVTALTNDGKTYPINAFTTVKDIKPAADRGFWFDVYTKSLGQTTWKRVWAEQVPILMD